MPHVFCKTRLACEYGLGYAQAQDRLWQLHMARQLAKGRLSEFAGEKAVSIDTTFRILGLERVSEQAMSKFKPSTINFFQQYSSGINKLVSELPSLPMEFKLTGAKWEPWTPVDCFVITKLIHYFTTQDAHNEVIRDFLLATFDDADLVEEMVPRFKETFNEYYDTNIIKDDELKDIGMYQEYKPCTENCGSEREPIKEWYKRYLPDDPLESVKELGGSNNWIVHGNHTSDGRPILSNDPHLGNGIPSKWHLASITYHHGEALENFKYGATYPGSGMFLSSYSKFLSWGITILFGDTSDLYEEKIEGDNYLYKGQWLPLTIYNETIKIKGGEDKQIQVRWTHHGPIIAGYEDRLENVLENRFPVLPEGYISLAWAGHKEDDNQLEKAVESLSCTNLECAIEKIKESDGLSLNIVLADFKGNIAYSPCGAFPKRSHIDKGQFINKGWTGEDEWLGFISADEKPHSLNPSKGYIATASNRVTSHNVQFSLGTNVQTSARAVRIDSLLQDLIKDQSGNITYPMINEILHDSVDVYASDKV